MYFLDNNSGTPDMPPLAPVQSHAVLWFTEGDKQKGISWPGQDWFNGFQAEHLNVLAEAGIAPDKTKLNQLTLAIKKLVSSGITTDIKDATTTQKGIVQLSSATDSASETLAATPKAVKAAVDSAASRMRQIRLPGNSATRWLKIAEMTPQANGEARLEIMLSGMADYGALAQGMAVDQVFMTTRSANTAQRVTVDTVGNFIQQTSLSRTANANEYVVGLTEEVNGSGVTTRYYFWLRLDGFAGVSSTMSLLNNTYTNVTVISDFTGANISATAPTGIVYGKRARFYTTETKPTATDTQAADWTNNFAAKMGVSRVISGANQPTTPGVWSVENSTWAAVPWGSIICTTNGSDLSMATGSGKYQHYVQISHESGGKPGLRAAVNVNGTFSGWYQALMSYGGMMGGEIQSTSANVLRMIQGDYGQIIRMDANGLYFLLTNKGDQSGNFNNLRPFSINNATGAVSIGTSLSVDSLSPIYKTGINTYNSGGTDYRQTNGLTMQGLGDQVVEVYLLEAVGSRTVLGFHVRGGSNDGWFECRNNGSLYLGGAWPAIENSAGTTWHPDGNIQGSAWGGDYLSNYLNNNFGRKFTASAGENGWRRDPDTGIIEQWMYCEGNQGGAPKGQWFNFPMAFPGACLNIQLTCLNSSNAQSTYPPQVSGTKPSNTGVNVCFGSNEWRFYVRATGV